ncbi:MAG: saccharopine dehydrogenase C-terminal domain-containing protein [Verrucomicrobiae bacterium]|nr:saccharopine dehydrogenase C-terminal domain-containing protein [Verrucomicrobiae bacterium]
MIDFNQRMLITGFGVVAQAALPMLLKHLRIPLSNITVIDFADREEILRPWINKGLRFVRERITPFNLSRLLSTHVGRGGLIVDLAWSINFFDILEWAHHSNALYINASLESWEPASDMQGKTSLEKSLYAQYQQVLPLVEKWRNTTTAVIDHGANPGLVSHFVKLGLLDIAAKALREKQTPRVQIRRLERLVEREEFAHLARELGVKVIHCSEWDSQRASKPKEPDEFVGTWSVEGMWEESISPSELGWGTHEKWLPPFSTQPSVGSANQIILSQMGLNTWVRSWVPNQEIVGMAVTHGESFSISHALTVHENGQAVYRPTVHYAYMPCNDTIVSLHELRCRNYELHTKKRILTDEITEGMDLVGALIMGHQYQSWWTGSILSIKAARKKVPHVNATAVQVAAGVLAAALWAIQNPKKGVCFPEELPHGEILRVARPYLGRVFSRPADWTPLHRHRVFFGENPQAQPDHGDPWQFTNFIFRP